MLKVAFFDLDDTLCNFSEAILLSINKSFEKYHRYFPNMTIEELMAINKVAYEEVYSKNNLPSSSKPLLTWLRIYELLEIRPSVKHFLQITAFQKKEMLKKLRLYKGVNELLRNLFKNKIKMGIITDGPYEDQARKIMYLGISHYFDYVISPDIALASKPSTAIYKFALKKFMIKPEEGVMVGNSSIVDLKGAKEIGMRTILITHNRDGDKINSKTADIIVSTIAALSVSLNRLR
jgi:putative hydrolase of the HAD superfamily